VDSTGFKINEPSYPLNPKMNSHTFNGAGVKYEIGISMFSGNIVWINGPQRGGKHDDITILREALKQKLEEEELVEADSGYKGEHMHTKTNESLRSLD
jgi:hypothetical protein